MYEELLRISRKFLRTKVWIPTCPVNETKGTVTDLLCNEAVSKDAARFRGLRCEGKALFREAHFQSRGDDADGANPGPPTS
jgi:hypothetical protein